MVLHTVEMVRKAANDFYAAAGFTEVIFDTPMIAGKMLKGVTVRMPMYKAIAHPAGPGSFVLLLIHGEDQQVIRIAPYSYITGGQGEIYGDYIYVGWTEPDTTDGIKHMWLGDSGMKLSIPQGAFIRLRILKYGANTYDEWIRAKCTYDVEELLPREEQH